MKATIKVHEEVVDVVAEKKKGSHIFVAQLFKLEEETKGEGVKVHPSIQAIIEQYAGVFEEPTTLPPKRTIP